MCTARTTVRLVRSNVEPISLVLIDKALDFLIDELHDIFSARRKRTKITSKQTKQSLQKEKENRMTSKVSKKEVLSWSIDAIAYKRHEREIQSLLNQLETHCQNLNRAEEQAAKWGEALLPSIIANTIDDEEKKILDKSLRLKQLIEILYKHTININIPT